MRQRNMNKIMMKGTTSNICGILSGYMYIQEKYSLKSIHKTIIFKGALQGKTLFELRS